MSTGQHGWTPGVESLLVKIDEETGSQAGELSVPNIMPDSFVGGDPTGRRWLRIVCDPRGVAADRETAAVRFEILSNGYRVVVHEGVEQSIISSFFDEMVRLLGEGEAAGSVGHTAMRRWRELLARPPGPRLTEKQLAGLFGELEVLNMIVEREGSLDAWTGWKSDQNDFRLAGLAIEVKATLSADFRRVRIHGLSQLDDPQDGSDLVLVLWRLERSPEGTSVPDLIDGIVAHGVSRPELIEMLSEVGYSDQHRPHYESFTFVSDEIVLRRIDEHHPRLTRSDFDDMKDLSKLDRIEYDLDLNGDDEADLDQDLGELLDATLGVVP